MIFKFLNILQIYKYYASKYDLMKKYFIFGDSL